MMAVASDLTSRARGLVGLMIEAGVKRWAPGQLLHEPVGNLLLASEEGLPLPQWVLAPEQGACLRHQASGRQARAVGHHWLVLAPEVSGSFFPVDCTFVRPTPNSAILLSLPLANWQSLNGFWPSASRSRGVDTRCMTTCSSPFSGATWP